MVDDPGEAFSFRSDRTGHCGFGESVATCIAPVQVQARWHPTLRGVNGHELASLAQKLSV